MSKVVSYIAQVKKLCMRITREDLHILYLCIAMPVVMVASATLPLFTGNDEEFHAVRAWSVSTLKAYPGYEDRIPKSLADSIDYSLSLKPSYGDSINSTPLFFNRDYNRILNSPDSSYHQVSSASINSSVQVDRTGRSTGPYAPIIYAPAAVGFAVSDKLNLSVGWSVFLARLFSGLACIFIIAIALFSVRKYKFKWVVFSIALFPSVLFQFSTITADSYTIAVTALTTSVLVSVILSSRKRISRAQYFAIGISLLLLAFVKINYVPFALIVLAIPFSKFYDSRKIAMLIRITLAITPIVIAVGLLLAYGSKDYYIDHSGIAGLDQNAQIKHILTDPLQFAKVTLDTIYVNTWGWVENIFGAFGWLSPAGPGGIGILLSLLAFMIAVTYSFPDFKAKTIVYLLAVGVVSFGSIFVSLYAAYTPLDHLLIDGIQGRYFIPILLVLGVVGARIIGLKFKDDQGRVGYIIPILAIVTLIITLVETYRILY